MSAESPSKTGRIDPKDNIRFLVACIHSSANGRPNFDAVAKELGIVSKGAAGKRYERLLKSHEISSKPAAEPTDDNDEGTPKSAKKRKAPAVATTPTKPSPAKKTKAAAAKKSSPVVKKEDDEDEEKTVGKTESDSSLSEAPESMDDEAKSE